MSVMKNLAKLLVIALAVMFTCAACEKKRVAQVAPCQGELIWHKDFASKDIYLTFDDGPNPEATPRVLDILKQHKVKAAFFLLGRKVAAHPEIVKRIYREGHGLGNHTYSHVGGLNVTLETISKELRDTDRAIKAACGVSPQFFRPPFGFFNYRYFFVAEKMGYRSVLWTIDAADWNRITSAEIESRLLLRVKGGYIVLLHDGGPSREAVIEALPVIIEKLKAKGLKFKPL